MEDASRLFGAGFSYFCDLFAIELRNLEALGLAQQKMFEGMGALAQRQAEIVDGTFRRSLDTRASANGPASPTHGSNCTRPVVARPTRFPT